VQGGDIEAEVGAVDNGGDLVAHFIWSYNVERRTIKGREATAVEL
jgi:hypothetical protein